MKCDKTLAQFPRNKRVVSFSFDDFPKSAIDNGARILEERKLCGTFYASLGMEHIDTIPSKEEMLSLSKRGHDVNCHTYQHTHCGQMSAKFVYEDCQRNKQLAYSTAGIEMNHFAYPFGEYKPSSKKVICNMYDSARTVQPGINSGCIDLSVLYAVPIDSRKGAAFANWFIDMLNNDSGWLVFFTHDVSDKPTTYGCTPEQLSEVVDNCIDAGFDILPVSRACEMCEAL